MRYKTKLVLHIPHFAYVNGQYEPINYHLFKNWLFKKFEDIGVDSWYITESTGCYKNRIYKQEHVVIFSNRPRKVEDAFKEVCEILKDVMLQDEFAYEKNNHLYTFRV